MNRLFMILVSGVVAGGFLTSALVLAYAQEPLAPRIEAIKKERARALVPHDPVLNVAPRIEAIKKERAAMERAIATSDPNRAAMLKTVRRRQMVNLTNQLRPLYRFELMSVRTACRLTSEQLRRIRPETDAAFDKAIARLFEARQNAPLGPVRVRSADLDYEKVIRESFFSMVKGHVPAERWMAFQEDLERREANRKQAGVEFLVATLDRELQLSGRQREQLMQSFSAKWDDLWYSALELTLGGKPCAPKIPDDLVRPYLCEIQQGIWSRMYKFEGPLWGVALDHGGDPELDSALGGIPIAEGRDDVRAKDSTRLLLVVTTLAIAGASQVPDGPDDEEKEKAQAQELQQKKQDLAWTRRVKQQFDQSVLGNGGWEPGARRELELRLAKDVDQFERPCELTESQKKKLFAAGRGDIKRFFDRVEEARRRIPEVRGGMVWPWPEAVQQEVGLLSKERDAILAGEGFFFNQALRHTLTEEQLGRIRKDREDRKIFRYRALVRWTVVILARSLGMTDDQRRRFETVLLEATSPPKEFGAADFEIVMNQVARIPADKVKPVFDDVQWLFLSRKFLAGRNQKRQLD